MNLNPFHVRSKHLYIGQIDIVELAKKYGTPFYAYDLAHIKHNYTTLRSCLPDNVDIFFAFKANPCIAVCALLRSLGAGAEVASEGELEIAKASGYSPEKIILNGPGKTQRLLDNAIETSVGIINIESQTDFDRLENIAERHKKKVPVCLRINPSEQYSHARIQTSGGAQKFGVDEDKIEPLIQDIVRSPWAELCGIHVYSGSQVLNGDEIIKAIKNTIAIGYSLAESYQFLPTTINLGGGLGIPYWGDENRLDLETFGHELSRTIQEYSKSEKLASTRFILELGRILVAEAGVYVTEILDVKSSHEKRFIVTDGGINHAMLPITTNKYPIVLLNKMDEANCCKNYIGGPLCTSADLSRAEISLPEAIPGDYMGILKSGAYGYSASLLNFLSFPSPAEIVVNNDSVFLARKHGNTKDFLRGQTLDFKLL